MDGIRFATEDAISLEGEIRRPDGAALGSAVICHAHPRHGGSKDHPILWAVRNELASRGFAVLSFNFRGTMRSAGSYAAGHAEIKDVTAAIGRIREEAVGPTVVCGWSFGANVALREAIADERVGALALIGLPLDAADLDLPALPSRSELRAFKRPVLLLGGEGDLSCPRPMLEALGRTLPNTEVAILPGTDHFLWRHEKEAAEIVGAFASRLLEES